MHIFFYRVNKLTGEKGEERERDGERARKRVERERRESKRAREKKARVRKGTFFLKNEKANDAPKENGGMQKGVYMRKKGREREIN